MSENTGHKSKVCDGQIRDNGLCDICRMPYIHAKDQQKKYGGFKVKSPDRKKKCGRTVYWLEDSYCWTTVMPVITESKNDRRR